MEPPFERLKGVISVTSGYTGGRVDKPTYDEVSSGYTGHREAVEVVYDPRVISYQQLLDVYWHNVDPLTPNAQFCDHGNQYRTAIFYQDDTQRRAAQASKFALEHGGRVAHVYTEIAPAGTFYPAEEYHQDYYKKNPIRYKFYRTSCGRDARVDEVWGPKN